MELIILAMWFAEVVANASGGDMDHRIGNLVLEAIPAGDLHGDFALAIFILVMSYWKMRSFPWAIV